MILQREIGCINTKSISIHSLLWKCGRGYKRAYLPYCTLSLSTIPSTMNVHLIPSLRYPQDATIDLCRHCLNDKKLPLKECGQRTTLTFPCKHSLYCASCILEANWRCFHCVMKIYHYTVNSNDRFVHVKPH